MLDSLMPKHELTIANKWLTRDLRTAIGKKDE
jgi:hypothetical protein